MNMDGILIALVASTVFMALMAAYKALLEKQVKAREHVESVVGRAAGAGVSTSGASLLTGASIGSEAVLKRRKKQGDAQTALDRLETDLERANMLIRSREFLMICGGVGAIAGLIAVVVLGQAPFIGILAGLGGLFTPAAYLKIRIWLRIRRAEAQFADVLDALRNCFKTGFGFNRAVQQIADNFEDPWGTEFGKIAAETNLGATLETTMRNLSRRIPLTDVDLFVTALLIQKETGGNMAELLGNISHTIRERFKLKRKVTAISAQGKLSASIVVCVPFFLMGVIYLFLPEPVTKFVTNPIGMVLLIAAGVWMVMGIGVLFKIVQIEV
ncbi:MAG: type II secretion system F family protein [Vampirovibrionales bacterium]|nr:type II secretion system F family protein [Vampirovibrionales bacterium]